MKKFLPFLFLFLLSGMVQADQIITACGQTCDSNRTCTINTALVCLTDGVIRNCANNTIFFNQTGALAGRAGFAGIRTYGGSNCSVIDNSTAAASLTGFSWNLWFNTTGSATIKNITSTRSILADLYMNGSTNSVVTNNSFGGGGWRTVWLDSVPTVVSTATPNLFLNNTYGLGLESTISLNQTPFVSFTNYPNTINISFGAAVMTGSCLIQFIDSPTTAIWGLTSTPTTAQPVTGICYLRSNNYWLDNISFANLSKGFSWTSTNSSGQPTASFGTISVVLANAPAAEINVLQASTAGLYFTSNNSLATTPAAGGLASGCYNNSFSTVSVSQSGKGIALECNPYSVCSGLGGYCTGGGTCGSNPTQLTCLAAGPPCKWQACALLGGSQCYLALSQGCSLTTYNEHCVINTTFLGYTSTNNTYGIISADAAHTICQNCFLRNDSSSSYVFADNSSVTIYDATGNPIVASMTTFWFVNSTINTTNGTFGSRQKSWGWLGWTPPFAAYASEGGGATWNYSVNVTNRTAQQVNLSIYTLNGTLPNGVGTLWEKMINQSCLTGGCFNATPHTFNVSIYQQGAEGGCKLDSNFTIKNVTNSDKIEVWLTCDPNPDCGIITTNLTLNQSQRRVLGNCFVIGAPNIYIDCAGYNITGLGGGFGVINTGYDNFTLKNCIINNFSWGAAWNGVHYGGLSQNNTFYNNSVDGIVFNYTNNGYINQTSSNKTDSFLNIAPIALRNCNNTVIMNSTANNTEGLAMAIYNGFNNTLANSSAASNNARGLQITANNTLIDNSTLSSVNDVGIDIATVGGTIVRYSSCVTSGSGYGCLLQGASNVTIFNTTMVALKTTGNALAAGTSNNSIIYNSTILTSDGAASVWLFGKTSNITLLNVTHNESAYKVTGAGNNASIQWYLNFSVSPALVASVNATPNYVSQSILNVTTDSAGNYNPQTIFQEFNVSCSFTYGVSDACANFSSPYTFMANGTAIYDVNTTVINSSQTIQIGDHTNPLMNSSSPENGNMTNITLQNFNFTGIDLGTGFANASIWIWNSTGLFAIVLNTSAVNSSPLMNTISYTFPFLNQSYNWSVQGCDKANNCGINETNRSLIINITPPAVIPDNPPLINYDLPADSTTYAFTTTNSSFNVTFTFVPFDDYNFTNVSVWLNLSGTWQPVALNTSALANGTAGSIMLNLSNGTYLSNVQTCDAAAVPACNFNDTNHTFTVALT